MGETIGQKCGSSFMNRKKKKVKHESGSTGNVWV
jgi:hypothetical protein